MKTPYEQLVDELRDEPEPDVAPEPNLGKIVEQAEAIDIARGEAKPRK